MRSPARVRLPGVPAALAALVALLPLLGACGYRVVSYPAAGGASGGDVRRVAVQTFGNDSLDPGYEFVVGDALRTEFARRGALRLVNDPAAAELVLAGRIAPIQTRRGSFSSVVLTLEYEVQVTLELEVSERRAAESEERPVDTRLLTERELYLASADVEATRKNREEALRRVAELLAARVHDVLYEVQVQ